MNCYTIVLVFCIVLELCLVIQICIISSDVADMSGFCRWNVVDSTIHLGTQDVWSLKVFKMDIVRETIGSFVDYGKLTLHHMETWMGITEER
ncbi:hypothetical protein Hanom_Chr10g00931541 [Helianthus anomalus]